jgi:hypothetical protein
MYKYVDEFLNPITTLYWVYNGIQYPPNIFEHFNVDELKAIGIYEVVYDTEVMIPDGKTISDYTFTMNSGQVFGVPVFVDKPVYVPAFVSRAQGKVALLQAGILDDVVAFIDAMENGVDKTMALLAFNETNEWRRDSPFLQNIAVVIGLTPEDLDSLFIEAATVTL